MEKKPPIRIYQYVCKTPRNHPRCVWVASRDPARVSAVAALEGWVVDENPYSSLSTETFDTKKQLLRDHHSVIDVYLL